MTKRTSDPTGEVVVGIEAVRGLRADDTPKRTYAALDFLLVTLTTDWHRRERG